MDNEEFVNEIERSSNYKTKTNRKLQTNRLYEQQRVTKHE